MLHVLSRAMADAGAAPAAPTAANPDLAAPAWLVLPEDNPDAASDADLAACATGLVAALRSGDSAVQTVAAQQITKFAELVMDDDTAANPRTVAALVTAGAVAALVQLLRSPAEVAAPATDALGLLMHASEIARRASLDDVEIDTMMQLLHESADKEHLPEVAYLLNMFTMCDEWIDSLSPASVIVSRILALPFIKTAGVRVASYLFASVEALVNKQPSFRHDVIPLHLSLLVELLGPQEGANCHAIDLAQMLCKLVQFMQTHDDFDFEAFDEAGGYVSCVESLGHFYRQLTLSSVDLEVTTDVTRVLSTAYANCPVLRPRFQHLLLSSPGALAGAVFGVQCAFEQNAADSRILCGFLDALRDSRSPEAFLLDTHFAACCLVSEGIILHPAYTAMIKRFKSDWRTTRGLRALARPLQHQRLAAAVTLSSMCGSDVQFTRILVAGDRLELLVAALIDLALDRFLEQTPQTNSRDSQMHGLGNAVCQLVEKAGLARIAAAADTDADETPAKRRRIQGGGAMLCASDVNVKRRDSTVLLIAGRPFYVNGALLETKSVVLADALSSVETLDPIAIALPNAVPDAQQYALFHAAVEHAYTGTVASDPAAESLLPLWCLGDHLQMDELCAWCVKRLVPVLAKDAALLERAWTTALARPDVGRSDASGDRMRWAMHALWRGWRSWNPEPSGLTSVSGSHCSNACTTAARQRSYRLRSWCACCARRYWRTSPNTRHPLLTKRRDAQGCTPAASAAAGSSRRCNPHVSLRFHFYLPVQRSLAARSAPLPAHPRASMQAA
jgi:hypothetical protein